MAKKKETTKEVTTPTLTRAQVGDTNKFIYIKKSEVK